MRRTAVLAVVALALGGCGGSSHAIDAKHMNRLVLRQRDLGSPFSPFSFGPQARIDNQGTPRANPQRYGREGGWVARYRRPGSVATVGPLVVESRADVFADAGGAKKDLKLYRVLLGASPGAQLRPLSLPKLGDEAVGVTFVQPAAKPLRFFRIAWRDRNATASVTAEGFDGRVREADAVALARKQERLLEHA